MSESKSELYRTGGDLFGAHRVLSPRGTLPQAAEQVDPSLPIFDNEILIDLIALNVDSASFHQIRGVCGSDPQRMAAHIIDIVHRRGKQHNPVTGSGGMLIGTIRDFGPKYSRAKELGLKRGDRVASLVSLTLTPLHLESIQSIEVEKDRVNCKGHAILFDSGPLSKLPSDIPEGLSLAALDVCGAPAHTAAMCKPGDVVVLVGGGGKSGILSAYVAKKRVGASGKVIALDYGADAIETLRNMSFIDLAAPCDARNPIALRETVSKLTDGKMANVVINVTNIPDTEMSCILAARSGGTVYFFSTATSFTKAALGSEGVGADVLLVIGNGYKPGHAELTLDILRESREIRLLYEKRYGSS